MSSAATATPVAVTLELDLATARALERVLRHGFVALRRDVAVLGRETPAAMPAAAELARRGHVCRDREDLRLTAPTLTQLGSAIDAMGDSDG